MKSKVDRNPDPRYLGDTAYHGDTGDLAATVLKQLRALANPDNIAGKARYGITTTNMLGLSMPTLRKMAKETGKDHALAQQLWDSGIHEARLLATLVDDHKQVTEEQLECWVQDLDSWDLCDQCCINLFHKTEFAYAKAVEWSGRKSEFVKRAGLVLMAVLAIHDKRAGDEVFAQFLPIISREARDERNFVRKAVNWTLRQIGKRNPTLNRLAVRTAKEILALDSPTARWIATDALRELKAGKTLERMERKRTKSKLH